MRTVDLFDSYLNGTLSAENKVNFETQLKTDYPFAEAFREHKKMIDSIAHQSFKSELKNKLKSIHEQEFGANTKTFALNADNTFAKRYGRTAAIAATTAIIAVLSTVAILSTGGYLLKQQNNQLMDLKREMLELKYSSEAVSEAIVEGLAKNKAKLTYAPANLEGSAFALNNNGYILTSFHMVSNADSIFIQNNLTERTLTRLIASDPKLDIAILKIENSRILKNWQVPFTLKEKSTDIGEKVFTLGYPRKDMVYGEGSLSSLSGYFNDTTMYQISIPVNPGNSGGPLLDDSGNIIGVIRGKLNSSEATGFAIKSNEIIKSIQVMAADSLSEELMGQGKKSALKNMKRSEQVKRINPYVFNVLVYKKD
jgi:serine protease Do